MKIFYFLPADDNLYLYPEVYKVQQFKFKFSLAGENLPFAYWTELELASEYEKKLNWIENFNAILNCYIQLAQYVSFFMTKLVLIFWLL